ncbi:MAG: KilA-N domain-containing protein, partial [Pedobacter sp.]|uniref:KilA-N domain-containing protein n=1 Tax=Pedobacter sp. TaxID=1411316 RepID=UPI0035656C3B
MKKDKRLEVKGMVISLFQKNNDDYICLTDMARYKNPKETSLVIAHWLRTGYTIEFIGLWEQLHNPVFNTTEFGSIKNQSISNSFILATNQWVSRTNAIGIFSKAGRYGGGTFAHKDIAFEFASWISPGFKLYLIKEFQRLKEAENQKLSLGWDIKRELAKVNYKIHTDAIKHNLVPLKINAVPGKFIYASEGDLLNKALFGMTAKEWREENPEKEGNIRDYSTIEQLVILSNL